MPAKRGKPDRETGFVICKQNILQKIKKFHSPIIQESGGGKSPPLAGIRKPLAESGAYEKMVNRISTANVEEPRKFSYLNP
jgi:molybdopterin-guanine dinucleotide biosynthesis protein A